MLANLHPDVRRMLVGASLALLATLYWLTMPRVITLEDAGLFQMVCHLGGISHPPGYPLFTMLCQQLVVGDSVVSGNLLSVFFALLATLAWYGVVTLLTKNHVIALMAMFAYGVSTTFWSQAIIIEVYSFAAASFMVSLWLLLKYLDTDKTSYWYALCLSVGIGLSNHWPLYVLSCVAFPVFLKLHQPLLAKISDWRFWLCSIGLLLLGLLPYLQLLMVKDPITAVFGAVSPGEFFDYVSRSYYDDSRPGATQADKLDYLIWLVPEAFMQLSAVGVPFIVIGLVRSFRILKLNEAIALCLMFLSTTFLLMSLLDMKFELLFQAIFRPYPVIAYAALSLWFAIGVEQTLKQLDSVPGTLRGIIAASLLLVMATINYPNVDRSYSRLVDEYGTLILESLPPNAILFLTGDNQIAPLGYLHLVKGIRPDVTLYSHEGLVFHNRLMPVKRPLKAWRAEVKAFIQAQDRPVFSIAPKSYVTVDYGLYYGFEENPDSSFRFSRRFENFYAYLTEVYQSDLITDSHEQQFVYNLLAGFTKQYLGNMFKNGIESMSQSQLHTLKAAQDTFPGKLTTIEVFLLSGRESDPKWLLEMALSAKDQIDETTPKQHRAVLFEYLGLIYQNLGEKDLAISYFEKSLALMPGTNNFARCHLAKLQATSETGNTELESAEQCR